jgi:hypothetical protein
MDTTTAARQLPFGTYHHLYDPEQHEAAWSGRLIYREVTEGGAGVVPGRVTVENRDALVAAGLDAVVDEFLARFRASGLTSGSEDAVTHRDGDWTVVGSPQGSYGYLYVTATLDRPRCVWLIETGRDEFGSLTVAECGSRRDLSEHDGLCPAHTRGMSPEDYHAPFGPAWQAERYGDA